MQTETQHRKDMGAVEEPAPPLEGRTPAGEESLPSVLAMSKGRKEGQEYLAVGIVSVAVAAVVVLALLGARSLRWEGMPASMRSFSRFIEALTGEGRIPREAPRPMTAKERQFNKHLRAAHALFREKRYDEAMGEYDRAIGADPAKDSAYYWRGQLHIQMGEYDRGIMDLQRSLDMNPANKEVFASMGWAHSMRGRWDDAIQALTEYIRYKPDNGWAYYQRGHCFYKKGERDLALKDARQSCDLGYRQGCTIYERFKR